MSTYFKRAQIIQRQTEKLHSALLSSISHDLKTPLVSITGTDRSLDSVKAERATKKCFGDGLVSPKG
jgi:K+-sensing histidine kinase KdpD